MNAMRELIEGKLPKNKLIVVLAWVELRKEDLLADWELSQNGETPFNIEPIRQGETIYVVVWRELNKNKLEVTVIEFYRQLCEASHVSM